MTIDIQQPQPTAYTGIDHATSQSGFTMASDSQTCSLLRTLAASKPAGRFLELGTGTGLSTSWILDDMLPQPNWPDGHQEKAIHLLQTLEAREDLLLTSQAWATGIIIGVKR
jgi:hypothetical protein